MVPNMIQVLPAGPFRPRGPAGTAGPAWVVRDPAAVIAESFAGRDTIPVDYDHQLERPNAAPAVAAGWITQLEARPDGIWAAVEWTPRAAEHISAREFRFISPAIMFAPDGTVRMIRSVALTNVPELPELMALNSARGGSRLAVAPAIDARGVAPELAVNAAIASGKLPVDGRAWALDFARRDGHAFARYVDAAPALNAVAARAAAPAANETRGWWNSSTPAVPPITEEDRRIAWLTQCDVAVIAATGTPEVAVNSTESGTPITDEDRQVGRLLNVDPAVIADGVSSG